MERALKRDFLVATARVVIELTVIVVAVFYPARSAADLIHDAINVGGTQSDFLQGWIGSLSLCFFVILFSTLLWMPLKIGGQLGSLSLKIGGMQTPVPVAMIAIINGLISFYFIAALFYGLTRI